NSAVQRHPDAIPANPVCCRSGQGQQMQFGPLKRREFITLLGGAAAWPLAARAQTDRVRRVGVLMPYAADEPDVQARLQAFHQGLQESGWIVGRTVQIDYRFGAGNGSQIRKFVDELIALKPDLIFATGGSTTGPLLEASRTIPIVFTNVPDPVGAGFVASLARPGGNATGFTAFEYGLGVKWLELLREIAPRVTRVAVLRNPGNPSGTGQFGAIQAVSPTLGVELRPVDLRDTSEIEHSVSEFAKQPNGGLIATANSFTIIHRDHISN